MAQVCDECATSGSIISTESSRNSASLIKSPCFPYREISNLMLALLADSLGPCLYPLDTLTDLTRLQYSETGLKRSTCDVCAQEIHAALYFIVIDALYLHVFL